MATQAITGRRARLLLANPQQNSSAVGPTILSWTEVRNWSLSLEQQMIDASSADSSGWNESIPGQRSWVFEAESVHSAAGGAGAARDIRNLIKAVMSTATGATRRLSFFQLQVNVSPTGNFPTTASVDPISQGPYWRAGTTASPLGSTFRGIVENFQIGGKYNDLQLFNFRIRGVGTLTYST